MSARAEERQPRGSVAKGLVPSATVATIIQRRWPCWLRWAVRVRSELSRFGQPDFRPSLVTVRSAPDRESEGPSLRNSTPSSSSPFRAPSIARVGCSFRFTTCRQGNPGSRALARIAAPIARPTLALPQTLREMSPYVTTFPRRKLLTIAHITLPMATKIGLTRPSFRPVAAVMGSRVGGPRGLSVVSGSSVRPSIPARSGTDPPSKRPFSLS